VFSVETTNRPQLAKEFVQKIGATFPIVIDDQKLSRSLYGVKATPTNLFIDRSGKIIFTVVGYGPGMEKGLAADIETLLKAS
jgi:thioredoxin-related protein